MFTRWVEQLVPHQTADRLAISVGIELFILHDPHDNGYIGAGAQGGNKTVSHQAMDRPSRCRSDLLLFLAIRCCCCFSDAVNRFAVGDLRVS